MCIQYDGTTLGSNIGKCTLLSFELCNLQLTYFLNKGTLQFLLYDGWIISMLMSNEDAALLQFIHSDAVALQSKIV